MQITFDPRELTAKDAAMLSEFILRFHGYVAPAQGFSQDTAQPEPAPAQDAEPGIDVDSSGLPWDERIHASSRAKNGDGTWRAKRGLNDPALVKKVEDELRARLASAAFAPGVPEGAQREIPMPPQVVPPAPFAGNAVPPAPPSAGPNSPIPSAPPAATAAPTASPFNLTFNDYVGRVAKGFASREITTDMSSAALKVVGLTDMGQLAARQDLTMTVAKELARLLAANGNFALAATFDPTVQAQ